MIDKRSLRAEYGLDDYSLEYEITDQWLDKKVEPKVKELAQTKEWFYEFLVDTDEIDPEAIRMVLNTKGYGVLSWPVAHQSGVLTKQVRMRVIW